MCVCMYIFRTCSRDSYCANHFCFRFISHVFVAIVVFQIGPCVFRWHVRFVICIVVDVLCMYLCRLEAVASHILFVSFYVAFVGCLHNLRFGSHVGFGIVSVHCVLVFCFLALQLLFAFVCTGVRSHVFFHRNQFLM